MERFTRITPANAGAEEGRTNNFVKTQSLNEGPYYAVSTGPQNLRKPTREKWVSSATTASPKRDFHPLEVTGDLHTPDINLFGDFNFSHEDLKQQAMADGEHFSLDLDNSSQGKDKPQQFACATEDQSMAASLNCYAEMMPKQEQSGSIYADYQSSSQTYNQVASIPKGVDLSPYQPCTSDALIDFPDLNLENSMDIFGCEFDYEGLDLNESENLMEHINEEVNLNDNNIVAQAFDQNESSHGFMDLKIDDFLSQINSVMNPAREENIRYCDLSTINPDCISCDADEVKSNFKIKNETNFNPVSNFSCGFDPSSQFSTILGNVDLSCANILEQAVDQTNAQNWEQEQSQFYQEQLINSFINTESQDCLANPKGEGRIKQERNQIKVARVPKRSFGVQQEEPKFSIKDSIITQNQNAQTIKIIINTGNGLPVVISHPQTEPCNEPEGDFCQPSIEQTVQAGVSQNSTHKSHEIRKSFNMRAYNSVSQAPDSSLRRRRKSSSSSRSSSSVSRTLEGFSQINLNEDWDSESDDMGEDDDATKLSRTAYAELTPAEKYFRMREQNNKASKKCREKKKLLVEKNIVELNLLEEENGRLNREYKSILRKVQYARQLVNQQHRQQNKQMYLY